MAGLAHIAAVLCLTALLSVACGDFLVEKGTLKYQDKEGETHSMPMALANFGKPMYGATTHGQLVYPATRAEEPHQCQVLGIEDELVDVGCEYGCVDFNKAVPPLSASHEPLHGIGSSNYVGTGAILLLDRGPRDTRACKFTLKAWHAQLAKASAVIIVNYENRLTTMDKADDEMTESYIQNLTIPAGFITADDGDALKELLAKGRSGKYSEFEDFELAVTLSWEDILPRSEMVRWEFWTNSNDACGATCDNQKQFIKEFAPLAKTLDNLQVVQFEPHYLIWVCPPQYKTSKQCTSQCIYQGRYCCPDPEDDLDSGYDGREVILENLRQLCVFKIANATGESWKWWDYVTQFSEKCKMADEKYNEGCAEQVFKDLGGENWKGNDEVPGGLQGLRDCIGDPSADEENSLLEHEKDAQIGNDDVSEVSILPTVRINGGQYRGSLSKLHVMRAICTSYPKDREPAICNAEEYTGADNECEPGEIGDTACKANLDGKTKCINTFGSYYCDCGEGWVSRQQGNETICLDLNECKYLNPEDLGPKCNCERCACHNLKGGYTCEDNIADTCSPQNNPCWQAEIDGVTYSACVDLINEYKELAIMGTASVSTPIHKCECPYCFTGDGMSCEKVHNFDLCDKSSGRYTLFSETGEPTGVIQSNNGLSLTNILIICSVVVLVAILGAYGVYRFQRRSHMDAEIRAIMAQYMPLDKENEENGMSGRSASMDMQMQAPNPNNSSV